jgi:SAM-dependent methyltransferase
MSPTNEEKYGCLADFRRAVLFRHAVLPCDVLEVGAFANPTVLPSEAQLKILDFYSTDELLEQAKRMGVNPERVLPVDYVCRNDDYLAVVPGRFDLIIANHVFEHVDNPVAWLQMVRRLSRDNALLLLVIPDKKYSFDKFRPDTALSHILYDYFVPDRNLKEVHLLETALYYDLTYIGQKNELSYKLDPARLRHSLGESHPGIHTHVFQAETFESRIMKPLLFIGLIDMRLLEVEMCRQFGEFAVVLAAGAGVTDMNRKKGTGSILFGIIIVLRKVRGNRLLPVNIIHEGL